MLFSNTSKAFKDTNKETLCGCPTGCVKPIAKSKRWEV